MSGWLPQAACPSLDLAGRAVNAALAMGRTGNMAVAVAVVESTGQHAAVADSGADRAGDIACVGAARTILPNTLSE